MKLANYKDVKRAERSRLLSWRQAHILHKRAVCLSVGRSSGQLPSVSISCPTSPSVIAGVNAVTFSISWLWVASSAGNYCYLGVTRGTADEEFLYYKREHR